MRKQAHKTTRREKQSCIAVYVKKEIHEALKRLAVQDGRSLSNYLNRILVQVTNT